MKHYIFWPGKSCCAHELTTVAATPEAPPLPEQLQLLEMVGRKIPFGGVDTVKFPLVTSNAIKHSRAITKASKKGRNLLERKKKDLAEGSVNG